MRLAIISGYNRSVCTPLQKTIKPLWGFLGLTRYYRKFVQDFGKSSASLTTLLKNDAF
jgi:hypothetical protein